MALILTHNKEKNLKISEEIIHMVKGKSYMKVN